MSDSIQVFDRAAVRRHRARAARAGGTAEFLFREAGARLIDRLHDVTRRFDRALVLGCRDGQLTEALLATGKAAAAVQADGAPAFARRAAANGAPTLVADEEFLPFAAGAFDLAVANLSLHWTNDLPGALIQVRHALRPDGLLLAHLFGGETLKELRAALLEAENELSGGASPRVSPFVDVRDAGQLLGRAGLALPVVDADTITVTYPDPLKLMADLRAMGETNAVIERRKSFLRRDVLARALEIYAARFADPRGRIVATFQLVALTGWAPHGSQQKPLRPGSAAARLADALAATETALDDPTPLARKP